MKNKSYILGFACAALLLAAALPVLAAGKIPAGNKLAFDVIRNGEKIGEHEMEFKQKDGKTIVDIETDIKVKVLFVTAYRFKFDGEETWDGDRLVKFDATVDDDGKKHKISAIAKGDKLEITADGKVTTVPGDTITGSWWNKDIVKRTKAINIVDGQVKDISVKADGNESMNIRGKMLNTTHYTVTGGLDRQMWYSKAGQLVESAIHGKDGSLAKYILK